METVKGTVTTFFRPLSGFVVFPRLLRVLLDAFV